MLGEHLNGFGLADAGVDISMEAIDVEVEEGFVVFIGLDEMAYALLVAGSDLCDVVSPLFPVMALSDFEDHLRIEGLLHFVVEKESLDVLFRRLSHAVSRMSGEVGAGADDDFSRFLLIQLELIHPRIETVIVGAKGIQDAPDDFEIVVLVEDGIRIAVGGDDDGNDDVAVFFPGAVRMTRPTDWTTSTWESREERKMTASKEGTSTPSERQRTFVRIRHSSPSVALRAAM